MFDWLPPGSDFSRDVTPADWVLERLQPWDPEGVRLGSFAPEGFETYARVFNPARPAQAGSLDSSIGVRWGDLAAAAGVELLPDVAFCEVSGVGAGVGTEDPSGLDDLAPMDGWLWPAACEALVRILSEHTKTPDACWFCLWEGNGAFWSSAHTPMKEPGDTSPEGERYRAQAKAQDEVLDSMPRVAAERRSYFLLKGPLEAASSFEVDGWYLSPNLWWPEDRAWIVVTEVDGYSTYLGGTRSAIQAICGSSKVEAIQVPFDVHMDPGPYRPRWR